MTFIFPLIYFVALANKKMGWVFLVLGVLMGLARIYVGVHYPLDIIFGILIGVLSAWLIEKIEPKIKFLK
jgi:PAP2 superfamily.